jgi:hypothetical protein
MNDQDLSKLLAEWLREHAAAIVITAQSPRGGQIEINNFLPDGWRAVVNVVSTEGELPKPKGVGLQTG